LVVVSQGTRGNGDAGLKDDGGRFRVGEHVELAHDAGVALGMAGAAHDDQLMDFAGYRAILGDGEGHVGEGADGQDGEVSGVLMGRLDDAIDRVLRCQRALGRRQARVPETVRTVDFRCGQRRLKQRPFRTRVNRCGYVQDFRENQGVAGCELEGGVAVHRRDGDHVQPRAYGGDDRGGVVNTRVGVDDPLHSSSSQ